METKVLLQGADKTKMLKFVFQQFKHYAAGWLTDRHLQHN